MSFPKYAKYKDSGVGWLGEVPEHWNIKRLGAIFRQADEEGEDDLAILSVSIHDGVSDKELDEKEMDRKVTRSDDRSKYKKVQPGDLVYNMMRAWQGGFGSVAVLGMVSPAYVVARPISDFSTTFVEHLLRTPQAIEQMRRYSQGVTDFRLRLYWDEFKAINVVLPPRDEQTLITEFLDRETAKIDGLVGEQRRLIELLKEKRQAVISHAVTKGLNPHAPMKPSGIEWLGDVPEHWDVERLKYSITKLEQGWSPQCDNEPAGNNEWGVLKVGCGNRDVFDPTEQKALPLDIAPLPEYEIKPGDILMSRGNTRDLVGMATIVKQVRPRLLLCDLLYRFHARHERVESEYLVFSLRSANVRFQIEREATGTSASMKKIGQGTIREFVICLPPLDEQRAIIASISAETAKLDTLTAEAQRAIDLLQERRTALISAAVTGKIDVRGLVELEAA